MKYYFAYGSNLNIGRMKHRCPAAQLVGKAEMDNTRLVFKGSKTGSYLTIEPCEGTKTPIGIWKITAADERALDHYEGFPQFYRKESINLGKHTGIIYIMNDVGGYGLPSDYYMDVCKRGYEDFGFDTDVLYKAYFDTKELMKNE